MKIGGFIPAMRGFSWKVVGKTSNGRSLGWTRERKLKAKMVKLENPILLVDKVRRQTVGKMV